MPYPFTCHRCALAARTSGRSSRDFVAHFCATHQMRLKSVDPEALDGLVRYDWPDNVRELRNVCERLVIFGRDPITLADLPAQVFEKSEGQESGLLRISEINLMPLRTFKTLCEREYIETILQRMNWDYPRVAEALDIHRSYLHHKITALGIDRRRPG